MGHIVRDCHESEVGAEVRTRKRRMCSCCGCVQPCVHMWSGTWLAEHGPVTLLCAWWTHVPLLNRGVAHLECVLYVHRQTWWLYSMCIAISGVLFWLESFPPSERIPLVKSSLSLTILFQRIAARVIVWNCSISKRESY